MKKKQKLGQFFTKNSQYIIGNLIDIFPTGSTVVDPFAGDLDLLHILPPALVQESYDIEPLHKQTIQRDTLLDPPNYKGKWIVTNPPYLARNKNKDKTIYDRYEVKDLYKASLKTIMKSEGGVIIIPLNFLSDEDKSIRTEFFENFTIRKLNIFEEQVFEDTTYTVCSFSFCRQSAKVSALSLDTKFFPGGKTEKLEITKKSGFRLGYEFYETLNVNSDIQVSRLVEGSDKKPTKLFLYAIDTGSLDGRIRLAIREDPFYGKNTDRAFATIVLSKPITSGASLIIMNEFNRLLEENRKKYHSVFLTNFRNATENYARKRISFDVAYKIIQCVIEKNRDRIFSD